MDAVAKKQPIRISGKPIPIPSVSGSFRMTTPSSRAIAGFR